MMASFVRFSALLFAALLALSVGDDEIGRPVNARIPALVRTHCGAAKGNFDYGFIGLDVPFFAFPRGSHCGECAVLFKKSKEIIKTCYEEDEILICKGYPTKCKLQVIPLISVGEPQGPFDYLVDNIAVGSVGGSGTSEGGDYQITNYSSPLESPQPHSQSSSNGFKFAIRHPSTHKTFVSGLDLQWNKNTFSDNTAFCLHSSQLYTYRNESIAIFYEDRLIATTQEDSDFCILTKKDNVIEYETGQILSLQGQKLLFTPPKDSGCDFAVKFLEKNTFPDNVLIRKYTNIVGAYHTNQLSVAYNALHLSIDSKSGIMLYSSAYVLVIDGGRFDSKDINFLSLDGYRRFNHSGAVLIQSECDDDVFLHSVVAFGESVVTLRSESDKCRCKISGSDTLTIGIGNENAYMLSDVILIPQKTIEDCLITLAGLSPIFDYTESWRFKSNGKCIGNLTDKKLQLESTSYTVESPGNIWSLSKKGIESENFSTEASVITTEKVIHSADFVKVEESKTKISLETDYYLVSTRCGTGDNLVADFFLVDANNDFQQVGATQACVECSLEKADKELKVGEEVVFQVQDSDLIFKSSAELCRCLFEMIPLDSIEIQQTDVIYWETRLLGRFSEWKSITSARKSAVYVPKSSVSTTLSDADSIVVQFDGEKWANNVALAEPKSCRLLQIASTTCFLKPNSDNPKICGTRDDAQNITVSGSDIKSLIRDTRTIAYLKVDAENIQYYEPMNGHLICRSLDTTSLNLPVRAERQNKLFVIKLEKVAGYLFNEMVYSRDTTINESNNAFEMVNEFLVLKPHTWVADLNTLESVSGLSISPVQETEFTVLERSIELKSFSIVLGTEGKITFSPATAVEKINGSNVYANKEYWIRVDGTKIYVSALSNVDSDIAYAKKINEINVLLNEMEIKGGFKFETCSSADSSNGKGCQSAPSDGSVESIRLM